MWSLLPIAISCLFLSASSLLSNGADYREVTNINTEKNKIDLPTTCTTGEGEGVNDIANDGIHTLYSNTVQNIRFKMEIKRKENNVYVFSVGVRGGH